MMASGKRNLLILTSSFPRAPGDSTCGYVLDFARSMASRFNVQVLAPPDFGAERWPTDTITVSRSRSMLASREPFQGSRDLNDLSVHSLTVWLGLFFSVLSFWLQAIRLAGKADVICSHWLIPSGLIGSSAALLRRKPHVVVEHSGALHLLGRVRGGSLLTRFIIRRADQIVVVSSDLRNKLLALCPEAEPKLQVATMGVSIKRTKTAAGTESVEEGPTTGAILFVGRLIEIKGLEVLLRAIEGERWRLLIAGEGKLRFVLEQVAAELRVDARFLGHVDAEERRRLFRVADVVVIPSLVLENGRTEGTSVVCLEALAAGCPVICSRVGGLAEIIVDGENGLLVEPGDHRRLREKLNVVMGDTQLRQKLSLSARRTAVTYDWSKVGARFAEIIEGSITKDVGNINARGFEAGGANG